MSRIFLSLVFLLLLSVSISAQTQDAPHAFAVRYIGSNFHYPLEQVDDLSRDDFAGGIEFEYFRQLSNSFDLSFPLRLAGAKHPLNADGSSTRDAFNVGLDALLNFNIYKGKVFRPRLFAGVGGLLLDIDELSMDVPLGVGLNFYLGNNTTLSSTFAYHINNVDFRDHLQAGIGIRLAMDDYQPKEPEVMDRDGDGIIDAEDLCPDKFGTAALNGCPDADGDGVTDASDRCPQTAGLAKFQGCPDTDNDGIQDIEDACPEQAGPAENKGCPITDRDGDGVADEDDECPDEAGTISTNGCPDRDNDGLADKDDACPNLVGTKENGGCPDTDGDGLVDRLDSCPNEAGPRENKGCPEIAQEDREVLVEAVQAVEFETASATIRPSSYAILNQVADILKRYPGYKVRVNGHTDSIGSASNNQQLSERRAKSCYDYLIGQGINASRLTYKGYGETLPIADNRYAPGREKNRRVEFDVYIE